MLTPYQESESFFLFGLECSIPAKSKYKRLVKAHQSVHEMMPRFPKKVYNETRV